MIPKREELQRIVAFLTGHGRFKKQLYLKKIISEPNCKFCDKEESAKHIMCECDAYADLRRKSMGKPYCQLEDYRTVDFETFRYLSKKMYIRMWTPINM